MIENKKYAIEISKILEECSKAELDKLLDIYHKKKFREIEKKLL
jgi:hypothetical protein